MKMKIGLELLGYKYLVGILENSVTTMFMILKRFKGAWNASEHSVKQDDNGESAEQIINVIEISSTNSYYSYL